MGMDSNTYCDKHQKKSHQIFSESDLEKKLKDVKLSRDRKPKCHICAYKIGYQHGLKERSE